MSVLNVKQYDRFRPIFSDFPNDNRPTLFLSELKHAANKNRVANNRTGFSPNDLHISDPNVDPFTAINFIDKEDKNDRDVHPAWARFISYFIFYRQDKTETYKVKGSNREVGKEILEIIKSLGKVNEGSVDELVRLVLEKLLYSVTDNSGNALLDKPSEWNNATRFQFKNVNNLRNEVIGNPMVPNSKGLIVHQIASNIDLIIITGVLAQYSALAANTKLQWVNGYLTAFRGLVSMSKVKYDKPAATNLGLNGPYPSIADLDNAINAAVGAAVNAAARAPFIAIGTDALDSIIKLILESKQFDFKYDKYFVHRLLADAATAPLPAQVSNWFTNQTNTPPDNKYFRDADGFLCTKTPNGTIERIDHTSPAYEALTIKDKCLGTGFKDHNGKTCADYLGECLEGGDVGKCKDFLSDPNFWANAQDEVKNMLPLVAHKTLKSFEFQTEEYFDQTANRRLDRIISYKQWLESLREMVSNNKLTKQDYDNIAGNAKLQGYLEYLVDKMNKNPGILNKDYTGDTDLTKLKNQNTLPGTRLSTMGLSVKQSSNGVNSGAVLTHLSNGVNSRQFSIRLGLPGPFGNIPFTLSGGSLQTEEYLNNASRRLSHILGQEYLSLVTRLKNQGKQISKGDEQTITDMIKDLEQKETKLVKLILMTDRYLDLVQVHGQYDNTGTITVDHLEKFVGQRENYSNRVVKKQQDVISVLKTILEAVNQGTPKTETKTETKTEQKFKPLANIN